VDVPTRNHHWYSDRRQDDASVGGLSPNWLLATTLQEIDACLTRQISRILVHYQLRYETIFDVLTAKEEADSILTLLVAIDVTAVTVAHDAVYLKLPCYV
jgi:hypothetical protein